ncbi:MAG: 4-alpha-glucanotransferase [Deltaproteobacteria bacterium]|nr:4-alpha-glucanotransferase [Deltaproteobacteria bacterium]
MRPDRRCGVLLHVAALPGPGPVGTVGAPARALVEWLALGRQSLWNILPLNPTGGDGCPYASYSAFAGNPVLIDLSDLAPYCGANPKVAPGGGNPRRVEWPRAIETAHRTLSAAFESFSLHRKNDPDFARFCAVESGWLDDFALFCALRDYHETPAWHRWPAEFRDRLPEALSAFGTEHGNALLKHRFVQWVFFSQWRTTRRLANGRGVSVIGDMPIFVSLDSADVWAHQRLFLLADHAPKAVAGVPPDYFAPKGQLWGNPLYDWEAMAKDGFAWWRRRFEAAFKLYDVVRIDHFRGFESYWEVPAGAPDATGGRWVKAPGDALFNALRAHFGALPVIAEDLGIITDEVHKLRERHGFPGMKVLQFAFGGGPGHPFLPHNYPSDNFVVFTGTHDNDTTAGWLASIPEHERRFVHEYLNAPWTSDTVWEIIRLAYESPARFAVVPFQDVIGAGSEARYNSPGVVSERNWSWRAREEELAPEAAQRLAALAEQHGRTARS